MMEDEMTKQIFEITKNYSPEERIAFLQGSMIILQIFHNTLEISYEECEEKNKLMKAFENAETSFVEAAKHINNRL